MKTLNTKITECIYVVVQFYPWFKFSFLLFLGMVMYDKNIKENEMKWNLHQVNQG